MQVGQIVAKIKGDLTDFNKNVKAAKTTAEGFKKSVGNASQKVGNAFKTMTKVTLATSVAVTGVALALDKIATRGGNIEAVTRGFEKHFGNAEDALAKLREASLDSISDFDLMLSANKAAMLGVTGDSSQLARLLTVAAGRAQELGVDTTSAFEDIVTGIGRMSPLILDNLGITTGAYKEQMAQLEANGIEMGEAEKKQLLLNTVLADSIEPTETAAVKIAQYKTELLNLKDRAIIAITPKIIEFLGWVRETVAEISKNLQPAFSKLKEFITNSLVPAIRDLSSWLGERIAPKLTDISNKVVELWGHLKPLRDIFVTILTRALWPLAKIGFETFLVVLDKTLGLVNDVFYALERLGNKLWEVGDAVRSFQIRMPNWSDVESIFAGSGWTGGVVESMAGGGKVSPFGQKPVPIIAHEGEVILNPKIPEQNAILQNGMSGGATFGNVIINNQMDFAQFKRELSLALRMA